MFAKKPDDTSRNYGSQGRTSSDMKPARGRHKRHEEMTLATTQEEPEDLESSSSERAKLLNKKPTSKLTQNVNDYPKPEHQTSTRTFPAAYTRAFSISGSHGPVTVYIKVVFLKIGAIEVVHEQYTADVYIQAKWRDPSLDGFLDGTEKPDFSKLWNPGLFVHNLKGEAKQKIWYELFRDNNGSTWVKERRRVNAKFQERMELKAFPFDTQEITLIISSELSRYSVEMAEDTDELSCSRVDLFSDRLEWKMYDFVEFEPMEISSQYSKDSHHYPGIAVNATIQRRPAFFAQNIIFVVALVALLSFTTFAVPVSFTYQRLVLSFLQTLSGITIRYVTNYNMPKISYLTNLDWYIFMNLLFASVVTACHAVLAQFDDQPDLQNTIDEWMFISACIVFGIYHILYTIITIAFRYLKVREMTQKQKEFSVKALHLTGDRWKHTHANQVISPRRRAGSIFKQRTSLQTSLDLYSYK